MANFLFYRYRFEKTGDQNLFSEQTGEHLTEENINERMEEDLRSKGSRGEKKLNLYAMKTDRSGVQSSEQYYNEIMRVADRIALLQVRNNKHKKVMPKDSTETVDVDHFPFCWVIVDTRPGSKAILVQMKKDTFKNADDVADLIRSYVTRTLGLAQLGWEMTLEKRNCVGTIWDIVRSRTAAGRDRVKMLSIIIEKKRANEANAVDKALQMVLEKLAAPEGEMRLTSDDDAKKLLDETKEDVRNTVDMLIDNQYRMRIGFEKSGSVEYGRAAEAVYGVDDKVCQNFEAGADELVPDYTLKYWLDALMPEDESHNYVQTERKKDGRRKKK